MVAGGTSYSWGNCSTQTNSVTGCAGCFSYFNGNVRSPNSWDSHLDRRRRARPAHEACADDREDLAELTDPQHVSRREVREAAYRRGEDRLQQEDRLRRVDRQIE